MRTARGGDTGRLTRHHDTGATLPPCGRDTTVRPHLRHHRAGIPKRRRRNRNAVTPSSRLEHTVFAAPLHRYRNASAAFSPAPPTLRAGRQRLNRWGTKALRQRRHVSHSWWVPTDT